MEKHSSGQVVSVKTRIDQGLIGEIAPVLAAKYAKNGIRVNAVAPGNIETPMHTPENHEALGAFQPIGRMGETSDVANAILFLDSAPFTSTAGKVLAAEMRHHLGERK